MIMVNPSPGGVWIFPAYVGTGMIYKENRVAVEESAKCFKILAVSILSRSKLVNWLGFIKTNFGFFTRAINDKAVEG